MTVLTWLGIDPRAYSQNEQTAGETGLAQWLATPGASIKAPHSPLDGPVAIEAGARLWLTGSNASQKHYFCDWLMGFVGQGPSSVTLKFNEKSIETPSKRAECFSVLGRSPLLYGTTLRDALLYRTQNVRKNMMLELAAKCFGPSLKARAHADNPLADASGVPLTTESLTAREHLEVAQVNVLLQRTPVIVVDLSSELVNEALEEGFQFAPELTQSAKTILVILPPKLSREAAVRLLGSSFASGSELNFG